MSEHCRNLIPAYVNNALTEPQRSRVEDHLASCESCRQYRAKVQTKHSRHKREALKNAQPDRMPNLFLNRQGRQEGLMPQRRTRWGVWAILILGLTAAAWLISRKEWNSTRPETATVPVSVSTDTVAVVSTPVVAGMAVPPEGTPAPTAASSASSVVQEREPDRRQWRGAFSLISAPREVLIGDAEAWRALWQEMGQSGRVPRIDFDESMVAGVFLGEKPTAGYEITLLPPRDEPEGVLLNYKVTVPPPEAAPTRVLTHAYHLRVIPRTEKKIRFVRAGS